MARCQSPHAEIRQAVPTGMGWLPSSPNDIAMCQDLGVQATKAERTANEGHDDRRGSCKERVVAGRGFNDRASEIPQETDTGPIPAVHGKATSFRGGHGSLRQCCVLGAGAGETRP